LFCPGYGIFDAAKTKVIAAGVNVALATRPHHVARAVLIRAKE
jgi:hypothetical protein